MDKMILSIPQVAEVTGLSYSMVSRAVLTGDLKFFHIGKRKFVRRETVEAWIEKLASAGSADSVKESEWVKQETSAIAARWHEPCFKDALIFALLDRLDGQFFVDHSALEEINGHVTFQYAGNGVGDRTFRLCYHQLPPVPATPEQ